MTWLRAIRIYLGFIAITNLIWEFAQLPFYTIWQTGTHSEIVFAAVHCTGGDILIAMSCLIGSLFVLGNKNWPNDYFLGVAALTIVSGLSYAIFSEWLNTEVRGAWAYSDLMPIVPVIGTGLSPFLQWVVLPTTGFGILYRKCFASTEIR